MKHGTECLKKSSFTPITVIKLFFSPDVSFITPRAHSASSESTDSKLCGIHTQTPIHIYWCLSLTQETEATISRLEDLPGSVRQSVRLSPCWWLAPSLSAFNCLFNGLSSSTLALLWELDCSLASAFLPDAPHQRNRSGASTPVTCILNFHLLMLIIAIRLNHYAHP